MNFKQEFLTEKKNKMVLFSNGKEVYRGTDANKINDLYFGKYYGKQNRVETEDFYDITDNFDSSYTRDKFNGGAGSSEFGM